MDGWFKTWFLSLAFDAKTHNNCLWKHQTREIARTKSAPKTNYFFHLFDNATTFTLGYNTRFTVPKQEVCQIKTGFPVLSH